MTDSLFLGKAVPRRDTRPGQSRQGVVRLIYAHLHELAGRDRGPKEIASYLGLSHEAVKKAIRRHPELFTQTSRGRYRVFMDAPLMRAKEVPEPEVHNVCITAPMSPSTPGALSRTDRPPMQMQGFWEGRRWTIQIHAGKARKSKSRRPRVAVYLEASDKPLGVPLFMRWVERVKGMLAAFGVDPESPEVKVREVEVNADYPWPKVGLRGWEVESLHGFKGGMLKAYYKRKLNVVRLEACLWPIDLTPAEAIRIFGELTRPLPADERPYVAGPMDKNDPSIG